MALQFRTIDGSNNNLDAPAMNQTDTDFARLGPPNFADGFNSMTTGPNPREISNIVVAQPDAVKMARIWWTTTASRYRG